MDSLIIISGLAGALLLIYLVIALIKPEVFL